MLRGENKREEKQMLAEAENGMPRRRSASLSSVSGYGLEALPRLRITSCFTGNGGTQAGIGARSVPN